MQNVDENIVPLSDLISKVFNNVEQSTIQNGLTLISAWKKVLYSIKSINNDGPKLASHTSIIDLKHGNLLIEVDHPGWSQILNLHKKYIIKGLQIYVPALEISNFCTRVKGQDVNLVNVPSDKEVREALRKKIEDEDKNLNFTGDNGAKNDEKSNLPPELNKIFEDMKNSMLTNL